MDNLRTRRTRISSLLGDGDVCENSATLINVNGITELLFISNQENHFKLCHKVIDISSDITSNLKWDKIDLSCVLSRASNECVGLDTLKRFDDVSTKLQTVVVVAMRNGELIEIPIDEGIPTLIGEIVDDVTAKLSGILCFASTPDGSNIAIVSPAKITLMNNNWDVTAEIPTQHIGVSANICWRGEHQLGEHRLGEVDIGRFFVVAIKSECGIVHSYVISRDAQVIKRIDADAMQQQNVHLNGVCTWQPRVGGLICFVHGDRSIVFFERNGLRHLRSDFEIDISTSNSNVLALSWSLDCVNLAIAVRNNDCYFVDLFTHRNYKWYSRKRILVTRKPVALLWDSTQVGFQRLSLLTVNGLLYLLEIQSCGSEIANSNGTLATVLHAKSVMVTNLSNAVIPPPMCHDSIELTSHVDEICGDASGYCGFGALLHDNRFSCVSLSRESGNKFSNGMSERVWDIACRDSECEHSSYRFPCVVQNHTLILVRRRVNVDFDELCTFNLVVDTPDALLLSSTPIDGCVIVVCDQLPAKNQILILTDKGLLALVSITSSGEIQGLCPEKNVTNPLFIHAIEVRPFSLDNLNVTHAFILCKSGHLLIVDMEKCSCFLLSTECSSFSLLNTFLTYTTFHHVLYCIPLMEHVEKKCLFSEMNTDSIVTSKNTTEAVETPQGDVHSLTETFSAIRPIDRGSKIIATPGNDVRLILQAPRGNLETIAPRPVVRARVRELVGKGEYGKAFRLCRRERIDMNEMVDVNLNEFLRNIDKMISQVEKADHLCIFLTNIEGEASKINSICDGMVKELKNAGHEYVFALLTAYVRKEPSEFENALRHVWEVKDAADTSNVSTMLDYLFVLCKNDEKLYNCALGTYNLYLAVLVAKCSKQLDPAEYGKELQALEKLDVNEMRFRIDKKLQRNDSSLRYLYKYEESLALNKNENNMKTSDIFARSIEFALKHSLFETALELFDVDNNVGVDMNASSEVANRIRGEYGSYLMEQNDYGKAAHIYLGCNDMERAAIAFELNGQWENAIQTINRSNCDDERKYEFYDSVARGLELRGDSKSAAHVRNTHLNDVDGALDTLIEAELWDDAILLCESENENESTPQKANIVENAVRECGERLAVDILDISNKIRTRGQRLAVVREMKRLVQERLNENANHTAIGAHSDIISVTSASTFKSSVTDLTFVGRSATKSVHSTSTDVSSVCSRKEIKAAKRRAVKSKKKRVKEGSPHEEAYLVMNLRSLVPGYVLHDRVVRILHALNTFAKFDVANNIVTAMNELTEQSFKLPDDCFGEGVKDLLHAKEWCEIVGNAR